jgi:hypothetical protein
MLLRLLLFVLLLLHNRGADHAGLLMPLLELLLLLVVGQATWCCNTAARADCRP